MGTWFWRPVRLKSSSMKSSDTSAKYSWPRREQNDEIQDSGVPEEEDMTEVSVWLSDTADDEIPGESRFTASRPVNKDGSTLVDRMGVDKWI